MFKQISSYTTQDSIILEPPKNNIIIIEGLVLITNKKRNGIFELILSDGINSDKFLRVNTSDAPITLNISFEEKQLGWKDAFLKALNFNDVKVDLTIFYNYIDEKDMVLDYKGYCNSKIVGLII